MYRVRREEKGVYREEKRKQVMGSHAGVLLWCCFSFLFVCFRGRSFFCRVLLKHCLSCRRRRHVFLLLLLLPPLG